MATSRKAAALVAGAVVLAVLALYGLYRWTDGEPYQERYPSPNGQYYVQKFVVSLPFPVTGPGQGSDGASGYIRLFTKDGKMLKQRRQSFLRDIKPVWAREKVYLLGVAEMDNDPWILPASSE
jgi:hypothetical protein